VRTRRHSMTLDVRAVVRVTGSCGFNNASFARSAMRGASSCSSLVYIPSVFSFCLPFPHMSFCYLCILYFAWFVRDYTCSTDNINHDVLAGAATRGFIFRTPFVVCSCCLPPATFLRVIIRACCRLNACRISRVHWCTQLPLPCVCSLHAISAVDRRIPRLVSPRCRFYLCGSTALRSAVWFVATVAAFNAVGFCLLLPCPAFNALRGYCPFNVLRCLPSLYVWGSSLLRL
jgi:hypothetical protein